MKKFTIIVTKKGDFNVFDDGKDGKKYFLEYLEKGSNQPKKVGYLVKERESGTGYSGYYLQEAFFDKRKWPHTSFRSVLSDYDADMNNDLWNNLYEACFQIEQAFWCKDSKRKRKLIEKSQKWTELVNKLQKGAELEKAVRSL